jgi:hypothetical protein
MASNVKNRGIVYWTERENQILVKNIDAPVKKLMKLLPSRSGGAIYQRVAKWKNQNYKFEDQTEDFTVTRKMSKSNNKQPESIVLDIKGVSIVINFQK